MKFKLFKSKQRKEEKKGISNQDIIPFVSPYDPFSLNHDPFAKYQDVNNAFKSKQLIAIDNHLKNPIYRLPSIDDISLPDISDDGNCK